MKRRKTALTVNATLTANFQSVTANFKPTVRHDTMEGRPYLVVPMVMLTEGVHAGSNGPLYYPPEELSKTPVVWNHKPIVIYHPTMNGQAISACEPDVINTRKVGLIMNTSFAKGKLKAEAWLEADRLKAVDERVVKAIEAGQMVEVSTGLFTDNEDVEGDWKGEKYTSIARNYRPDHLAILPDQKGACSIADGGGLLRNQSGEANYTQQVLARAMEIVQNEMSQSDTRRKLEELVRPKGKSDGSVPMAGPWIDEVFETFFVYQNNSKTYSQGFTQTGEQFELVGSPQEVTRVTQYKTADGKIVGNSSARKGNKMDKKKFVDDLIANAASPWEEDDREYLMAMNDTKLTKLAPVVNQGPACPKDLSPGEQKKWDGMDEEERAAWLKSRKAPAKEDDKKPAFLKNDEPTEPETVEEYIERAPDEIRDMLTDGLAAHNAEKGRLIKVITANKNCDFAPDDLSGKNLKELRAIAKLAAPAKRPVQNYSGMADVADPTANSAEEPLVAPSMTFGKE